MDNGQLTMDNGDAAAAPLAECAGSLTTESTKDTENTEPEWDLDEPYEFDDGENGGKLPRAEILLLPEPDAELVQRYNDDEFDRFTDAFLGDLFLGIQAVARPTNATRMSWLAEIKSAQAGFRGMLRWPDERAALRARTAELEAVKAECARMSARDEILVEDRRKAEYALDEAVRERDALLAKVKRWERDREDAIHPFWEVCDTVLGYEPEMGPEEENPGTWPTEHPIWSLLTEVGNYIFRDQGTGNAWMYATATSDIEDWEFGRLGGTTRVAPERHGVMASRLAALRALVPERSGREVTYREAWERLQAVAEALWGEVAAPQAIAGITPPAPPQAVGITAETAVPHSSSSGEVAP